MPGDQRPPTTPAWKQGIKPAEKPSSAQPAWRREQAPPPSGGWWTRRTKLWVGGGGLALAAGLFVWVVYWFFPPKQACLVLLGADYVLADRDEVSLAVPHNAYGWQGLKSLADAKVARVHREPEEYRQSSDWDHGLNNVAEKTVIVNLALHGGADGTGPYLLPQDANPWEENKRIRLDDIFRRLEQLDRKKKVLILDATQPEADWLLGMVHNDFARALREKFTHRIEEINDLVVLCSSDVDQRSWYSEEYRQTIFAHFVQEGLRGAADEDGNGRITADELADYVSKNVERWAAASRNALQKPFLLGGTERARSIELAVASSSYQPPDPRSAPGYATPDLAKVREQWQKHEALRREVPTPYVYTPQLWRRYEDTLLLYEQLVRAGSDEVAKVEATLGRLEDEIARGRSRKLPSVQNSAAMPAALGLTPTWPDHEAALSKLGELWNAGPEKQDELWTQWQTQVPDPQLLRLRLSTLIVERAAQDARPETLDKASKLLQRIGATDRRRPVEAHFLAMLRRDLDPQRTPGLDLLQNALQLRELAEESALAIPSGKRAHPYSEVVFPWIKAEVVQADERRTKGEDLLFATQEARWNEAETWFRDARQGKASEEGGYMGARRDAAEVRQAFDACQRSLSLLPYLSEWAAQRPEFEKSQWDLVQRLWRHTHLLAQFLETREPQTAWLTRPHQMDPSDTAMSLPERTKSVSEDLDTLEKQFHDLCKSLPASPNPVRKRVYQQIEAALLVPDIDPELRLTLLGEAETISHEIHVNAANAAAEAPISTEQTRQTARDQAQRQGNLALWSLGQRWFNDRWLDAAERADQVASDIANSPEGESWSGPLIKAGDQIGRRWARMAERVNQLTEQAHKENLDTAAEHLQQAEQLARQMEGASVRMLARDPVEDARDLRLHDLLLWQAERTLHDHWYAEDPRAEQQYYQLAGTLYVRDAGDRVRGPATDAPADERLKRSLAEEAKFKDVAGLMPVIEDGQNPELTSEQRLDLRYRLVAKGKGLPAGFPVVWMDPPGKGLTLQAKRGRQVTETDGQTVKSAIPFQLERTDTKSQSLVPDQTAANLRGLYRGQQIGQRTPINIYHAPDILVAEHFDNVPGGLAVRADDALRERFAPQNGALAIVLDCTGSMGVDEQFMKNNPYTRATPCKYHNATTALRRVLQELPEGTTLSLLAFGQAIGRRTPNGYAQDDQPEPNQAMEMLRPPHRWDRQQLDSLMAQLEDLLPFNETPLVRAMWRAKREGFPSNFSGFKTMLVLTDGEDNCFYHLRDPQIADDKERIDPELTRETKDIPTFLQKEFKDSGIQINMIGFAVTPSERMAFKNQFEKAIKDMVPPGHFYEVKDTEKLVETLRRNIKQTLKFRIYREGGVQAEDTALKEMPEDGHEVSPEEGGENWVFPLRTGWYRVSVFTDRRLEQRVHIDRGDYLLLNLRADGLGYERVLLGESYRQKYPSKVEGDWLLTVPQNELKRDGSLEMMLTLENRQKHPMSRDDVLQQIKPSRLWLEVEPQGVETPVGVRWTELPGYAGPAWGLTMSPWPNLLGREEPARPLIHAWWNWPSDRISLARVGQVDREAGAAFDTFFHGKEEQSFGDDPGDKYRIENIRIEEHMVHIYPGAPPEKATCLVVRASFPRKPQPRRIWVEPIGLNEAGHQHEFYSPAGKYTGLFWPITEDTARRELGGLRIYSVDKLKNLPTTQRTELKLEAVPDQKARPLTIPQRRADLRR
jgi:hypothetical protein